MSNETAMQKVDEFIFAKVTNQELELILRSESFRDETIQMRKQWKQMARKEALEEWRMRDSSTDTSTFTRHAEFILNAERQELCHQILVAELKELSEFDTLKLDENECKR